MSVEGNAVLILGPSGAGKSSLALNLIALGASLVSDDQTRLTRDAGHLIAAAPDTITGLIEARGVGLLTVPTVPSARIRLIVDLSQTETKRLPEPHTHTLHGITFPCLWSVPSPHFAAAILLSLRAMLGAEA